MIYIKLLLFFFLCGQIQGQLLEKESAFDLNSFLGNLFPNFGVHRNPQANYPGASQYPTNGGQMNNPQGNIWNNGNGNPGMNYPANSQYYPGNAIQGQQRPTGNENTWNNAGLPANQVQGNYPQTSLPDQGWNNPRTQTGYPNQQVQGQQRPTGNENTWNNPGLPPNQVQGDYPQTALPGHGWNSPQIQTGYPNQQVPQVNQPGQYPNTGRNWNGVGANVNSKYPNSPSYPQNGLQTGAVYPGQESNSKNPDYYQSGNAYPSDNIQKLNPNYPTANNWNNGLNPRVNYPGNPQPYPVNGIQTGVPNNWNSGNQRTYQNPSQLGYQNGQGNPSANYQNGYPSQAGYPSQGDSYTGFRNEVSQYPNQSEQADVAVTTEKAAILGNPVIISEIKPPSTPKSKVDNEAQKKCVQDCSTSTEYQPICGTNKVTYFNEEKFECAQKCGIEVAIQKKGACDEQ